MNIGTMIKRLQDIMRQDAGINGDAQRIEQIVCIFEKNCGSVAFRHDF